MIDIRKFRHCGSGIVVFVEEPQQKWCGWFWMSIDYIVDINEEHIKAFFNNRFSEFDTSRAIFCWHRDMPNESWYGPQSLRLENPTGSLARNVTLMHDELIPNRLLKKNMHAFTSRSFFQRHGPLMPMNKIIWGDLMEVFFEQEEDALLAVNLMTVMDEEDVREMNYCHSHTRYSYARFLSYEEEDRSKPIKNRYEMSGPSGQKFFFDFETFGGSFKDVTNVLRQDT